MQLRGINANQRAQCADRRAVNTQTSREGAASQSRGGWLNHLTDELNVFASLGQQLIPLILSCRPCSSFRGWKTGTPQISFSVWGSWILSVFYLMLMI